MPKRTKYDSITKIGYVPHGVNSEIFRKLGTEEELANLAEFRRQLFNTDDVTFAVLYNNRNIRRKSPGDVVLAFKYFQEMLTEEEQKSVRLVMHTAPVDENGTNLYAVLKDCAPNINVVFSSRKMEPSELNMLYNSCDVCINLASNEGFGLSTLEAIMAELMVVATVTGGLQDQMGFMDDEGNYLDLDKHYTPEWSTNHRATYTKCGPWALPVFPSNISMIGSIPTPYIYDDRPSPEDAAQRLLEAFRMTSEERARRGALGRDYALQMGMDSSVMANRIGDALAHTIETFVPKPRFGVFQ